VKTDYFKVKFESFKGVNVYRIQISYIATISKISGAYIFVVEAPFSDEDSICYTSGSKSRSETKYTTLDKEVPVSYKAVAFISGLQTGNFATNPRLWVDNAKVSGDRVKVDFNTKSPTCVQFAQATVLLVDPHIFAIANSKLENTSEMSEDVWFESERTGSTTNVNIGTFSATPSVFYGL